jgi:hypothetical protein
MTKLRPGATSAKNGHSRRKSITARCGNYWPCGRVPSALATGAAVVSNLARRRSGGPFSHSNDRNADSTARGPRFSSLKILLAATWSFFEILVELGVNATTCNAYKLAGASFARDHRSDGRSCAATPRILLVLVLVLVLVLEISENRGCGRERGTLPAAIPCSTSNQRTTQDPVLPRLPPISPIKMLCYRHQLSHNET